jgi:hypothetical protein
MILSAHAHSNIEVLSMTDDYLTTHTSLSPNTAWVRARLCKLQKGCPRLAVASDKAYQLLTHGR